MTGLARPELRTPQCSDDVERFVRRHQADVWRFLRALGCQGADAEDLTQDALLLALERGLTDWTDAAAAAVFLRRAARFLWLRRHRDATRRERRVIERAAELWERDCADDNGSAWLDALQRCVEALPERSRRALELRYRDDASRDSIANELGIGAHGARTLLQRLRAALRGCIERRIGR